MAVSLPGLTPQGGVGAGHDSRRNPADRPDLDPRCCPNRPRSSRAEIPPRVPGPIRERRSRSSLERRGDPRYSEVIGDPSPDPGLRRGHSMIRWARWGLVVVAIGAGLAASARWSLLAQDRAAKAPARARRGRGARRRRPVSVQEALLRPLDLPFAEETTLEDVREYLGQGARRPGRARPRGAGPAGTDAGGHRPARPQGGPAQGRAQAPARPGGAGLPGRARGQPPDPDRPRVGRRPGPAGPRRAEVAPPRDPRPPGRRGRPPRPGRGGPRDRARGARAALDARRARVGRPRWPGDARTEGPDRPRRPGWAGEPRHRTRRGLLLAAAPTRTADPAGPTADRPPPGWSAWLADPRTRGPVLPRLGACSSAAAGSCSRGSGPAGRSRRWASPTRRPRRSRRRPSTAGPG